MASLILAIEDEVVAAIEAAPEFVDIPVLAADRGDLESNINEALNRIGQFVVVVVEKMQVVHPNLPGPRYEMIRISVVVGERPALRPEGGKPAVELAEIILGLVHHLDLDVTGQVVAADTEAMTYLAQEGVVQWSLAFITTASAPITVPAVADITRGTSGSDTTLSCATGGAAIFYTTDGRFPSPRVGTRYTAPFPTPSAGTRLRALAWLAGYKRSLPIDHTF
jgi:hypothetical protein